MSTVISSLNLLDPKQVCFHESHEHMRLEKICRMIEQEGELRNPPIVSKMSNGNYLLLDGAHRMKAMMELGCKRVAVQIVQDDQVQLNAWNHMLPAGEWIDVLRKDPLIFWSDEPLQQSRMLARITDASGQEQFLYSHEGDENVLSHLETWHRIVGLYQHEYHVRRHQDDVVVMPEPNEWLLSYPAYALEELKRVVEAERLMPAGVTRCVVKGRLLNLRIPLELLRTEEYAQDQWESLRNQWSKSLRFYTEPVYMYES